LGNYVLELSFWDIGVDKVKEVANILVGENRLDGFFEF